MTSTSSIAIVGAGNMGTALLGGLLAKQHPKEQLWASDPSSEKLADLHKKFGLAVTTDNIEAIQNAGVIIFAVKPQTLSSVCKKLAPLIQERKPLLLSIAAGVREKSIQEWLGGGLAIVRCMPNIAALIGCGATGLYANAFVSRDQRALAESILSCLGLTVWLEDEKQMDTVTALSGSGPAYFFLLIEALQQAGQDLGLPQETARLLSIQTAYGAARLALESKAEVAELRQRVTSPGGTTERALAILEKGELGHLIAQAVSAAKKRAEELSGEV